MEHSLIMKEDIFEKSLKRLLTEDLDKNNLLYFYNQSWRCWVLNF